MLPGSVEHVGERKEEAQPAPSLPLRSTVGPATLPQLPADVKILVLEEDKLLRIFKRLAAIPALLEDRSGGVLSVAAMLLRRDVVAVELGDEDGIVYAERVEPGGHAYIHIVVFNRRKLLALDTMLHELISWAFKVFRLAAMSAWIPNHNKAAIKLMTRLGWQNCGTIRSAGIWDGKRRDILIYEVTP